VEAGRKIHVQPRVIAEVTESQMGQMHGDKMNCEQDNGEFLMLFASAGRERGNVALTLQLFFS